MLRFRRAAVVVSGAVMLTASNARAFAEDVCFPEDGGTVRNCSVLPDVCLPVGTETVGCRLAAASAFVLEGARTTGTRSLVHADATHLLAQAVGFGAADAYWIAAYDEVVDYGVFEPTDMQGAPYGGGTLKTAVLDGLVRTNLPSGGMLLHFLAPYNGGSTSAPASLDGLHPNSDDAHVEILLAHLKSWAMAGMAGSGPSRPECTGGLTLLGPKGDYAGGSACFAVGGTDGGTSGGTAVPIHGSISAVATKSISFDTTTGPQILVSSTDGGAPTLSPQFDALVGGDPARVADARLGIYLHVLGDRISHHVCSDHSVISGPTDTGWNIDMTHVECAQGIHALRHMWETGIDFDLIAPEERTTAAGLASVFEALVTFASLRGVLRPLDAAAKTSLLAGLTAALEVPEAAARIQAIANIACARGLAPFPGLPGCSNGGTVDGGSPGTDGALAADGLAPASNDAALDANTGVPASATDADTAGSDAGVPASATDAGSTGSHGADAAAGPGSSDDGGAATPAKSGCSCSLPGQETSSAGCLVRAAGLGLLATVWAAARTRRRRRSTPTSSSAQPGCGRRRESARSC